MTLDLNKTDVLDPKILTQLKSFARSEGFLPKLIGTFEEHGRQSLSELEVAFEQGDRDTLGRVAHRFKGSCLNIGAGALAERLRELEAACRGSGPVASEDMRPLFALTCQKLKDFS